MNIYLLICLLSYLFMCCFCQPPKSGVPHKRGRKKLNDTHIQMMRDFCRGRGCNKQSAKAVMQRDMVKRHMVNNMQNNERSEDQIERQLTKTYQAKKAIMQEMGLTDIEPSDNGFFGGDMLLSEAQANRIINRAQGVSDPGDNAPHANSGESSDGDGDSGEYRHPEQFPNSWKGKGKGKGKGNGGGGPRRSSSWHKGGGRGKWGGGGNRNRREVYRRNRAASLSLDTYTGNKWPTNTLNYYINPDRFSESEAQMIRRALAYIQSKTCIKFNEAKQSPYIEYLKTDSSTDAGTCGWAYMGYQGRYNPVHINFNSRVCRPTLSGVIAHETLHTLGLSHEHTRYDRDRYLSVQWRNVDPQAIDVFDKDDPYDVNPYCNPYDYLSVMHYDCYVGSRSADGPSVIPKNGGVDLCNKIGNALKPSDNDINLVNKLYCTPDSCKDTNPYCGFSCNSCSTKYLKVCPKSCDQCSIDLQKN